MATTTRASTRTRCLPPTRKNSSSCSTCSSLACSAGGISPISSRKMVPPSASSNLPGFSLVAPVKAPRSWPKSSLSSSSPGSAAQLILTKGLPRRGERAWIVARETSLPTPRLAADQHRHVGVGDAVDHVPDGQHGRAGGDEVLRHPAPRLAALDAAMSLEHHRRRLARPHRGDDGYGLRLVRRRGPRCRAAAFDGLAQLLRLDRLDQVVARAQPHGLDHGVLLVHGGERDHRGGPTF